MVDATFTVDEATDTIVDATGPYGTLLSSINVYLGTEDWGYAGFDLTSSDYCFVTMPLAGATDGGWASGLGLWAGFDYDPGNAPLTNCNTPGYELDPLAWGTQLEVDLVTYYSWGVGIGEIWPTYAGAYTGTAYEDQILGG